jgi:ABC-type glycerol-3-phosphate transport system substrate-binding protein
MKKISLVSVFCLLLSFCPGCTKEVEQVNDSLTLWAPYITDVDQMEDAWPINQKVFLEKAIQEYNRESEIKITPVFEEVEPAQLENYYSKLYTAMMAGNGPDIILFDHVSSRYLDIYKTQDAGALADLTELMEGDEEFERTLYFERVLDAAKRNGKQYVIPCSLPHMAVHC